MAKKPQKKEVETTGHSWDGIEEFNNPLPRWWVWIFYACIVWAIWYSIAYPAWPGIKSATAGYLGWSTRGQLADEEKVFAEKIAVKNEKLLAVSLDGAAKDPELYSFAVEEGRAVFNTWCTQCHQREGAGVAGQGYPRLSDDDWLWGGALDDIAFTVTHGIRNEDDPDGEARFSQMPAFGKDELLEPAQIEEVANFVMTLSGETSKDASKVEAGKVVFEDNCAACHMEDGSGDRAQGAPNLSDAIWLYGGDYKTIVETVTNARFGVMPNWNQRLNEAQIRAVALYVHQLGGGE